MRADAFKRALHDHPELHHMVLRYTQAMINQIS